MGDMEERGEMGSLGTEEKGEGWSSKCSNVNTRNDFQKTEI